MPFMASELALEIAQQVFHLEKTELVDELVGKGRRVQDPFKEVVPYELFETALILQQLIPKWVGPDKFDEALKSLESYQASR